MDLDRIRRETRELLGNVDDVSYIDEALLSHMEQSGEELACENGWEARTYYGTRVVDAKVYVAFCAETEADPAPGLDETEPRVGWLKKPVRIERIGRSAAGQPRYALTKSGPV